ncbi:MAG: bifunctional 4-hydroxy-2-oxoglutarate aldolase/2-dehydro-3-deoxy-phosphogluconate aldolase [Acidimicrobiales bacterium]
MSDLRDELKSGIEAARLIVIIRLIDHANVAAVAETLVEGGVQYLEVTVERPEGLEALRRVVEAVGESATVGAGTVVSREVANEAAERGARFIVTPNANPNVIASIHELGLLALPGAFTPTEVDLALSAGARLIKLFPASTGGVAHLRALQGPFSSVKFVPTGGVTAGNAAEWFEAGAVAVAMGSNLVPSSGALDGLLERTQAAIAVTGR